MNKKLWTFIVAASSLGNALLAMERVSHSLEGDLAQLREEQRALESWVEEKSKELLVEQRGVIASDREKIHIKRAVIELSQTKLGKINAAIKRAEEELAALVADKQQIQKNEEAAEKKLKDSQAKTAEIERAALNAAQEHLKAKAELEKSNKEMAEKLSLTMAILNLVFRNASEKKVYLGVEVTVPEKVTTTLKDGNASLEALKACYEEVERSYVLTEQCIDGIEAHKQFKWDLALEKFDKVITNGGQDILKALCGKMNFVVDLKNKSDYDKALIHKAAFAGSLHVIKCLIALGANKDILDGYKDNILHAAAWSTSVATILYLLQDLKIPINEIGMSGMTALHRACITSHIDVAKCLIENGATIDAIDVFGFTPLFVACRSARKPLKVVKLLIKSGAKLVVPGSNCSILHEACAGQSFECVKYLFDRYGLENVGLPTIEALGRSIVPYSDYDGSLLWASSRWGCLETVKYLVEEKKAAIHFVNKDGQTTFFAACANGDLRIVLYLIEKGVDLTKCDNKGIHPFHSACKCGNLDVVKYFLDKNKALLGAVGKDGMKALHYACNSVHRSSNRGVVRYFVDDWGAKLEEQDAEKRTPLHIACLHFPVDLDNQRLIKDLLERGAKITPEMLDDKQKIAPEIRALLGWND